MIQLKETNYEIKEQTTKYEKQSSVVGNYH